MKISTDTKELLQDIERRIDPAVEDDYLSQWLDYWNGSCKDPAFFPRRKKTSAPAIPVKQIHINDALHDREQMLYMQLAELSSRLNTDYAPLGIRANYGTGIMTSLFGASVFEMPREMATLPTTRPLNDTDAIRRTLEKGIPDLNGGFGADVFAFGETCTQLFKDYPNIARYVHIYHPDTQGPLDIAELLWGGDMFYEMYDDPDFVHSLLTLITHTYTQFMERWYSIVPKECEISAQTGLSMHWNLMYRGPLMIRDDSAMNISGEMYREFALPYDAQLLKHFGGGCIHFCGRGDHYIDLLTRIPELSGFNPGQPHLNDFDRLVTAAARDGKKILSCHPDSSLAYAARPDAIPGIIHSEPVL